MIILIMIIEWSSNIGSDLSIQLILIDSVSPNRCSSIAFMCIEINRNNDQTYPTYVYT